MKTGDIARTGQSIGAMGGSSFYTINLDETGLSTIFSGPQFSSDIAWSPDGSRIALAYYPNGVPGDSYIYIARGDGTCTLVSTVNLAYSGFTTELAPGWNST